jgi:hypothetical protein
MGSPAIPPAQEIDMNHIVTSKDGLHFAVNSAEKSVAFDRAFAAGKTSAELAAHGDFTQVKSLDDLLAPEEYTFSAPRISGPLEKRKAFRVIKGGKQS